MKSRQFEEEKGRVWNVIKIGSTLTVDGENRPNNLNQLPNSSGFTYCGRFLGLRGLRLKSFPYHSINPRIIPA
jgi:hypothetical protein